MQRAHAVVLDDARAAHLADEARAEHPPDRAAGVVGAEAEQERRADAVLAEQLDQRRHALARAAQRVDVDLEREAHGEGRRRYSTSARADATWPR